MNEPTIEVFLDHISLKSTEHLMEWYHAVSATAAVEVLEMQNSVTEIREKQQLQVK